MRKEYDFKKLEKIPNAKHLRKPVTIRLDMSTVEYFKDLAQTTGIKYQNLINLYLVDCAHKNKKLDLVWKVTGR